MKEHHETSRYDGTVALLEQTSNLVTAYTDAKPISSLSDSRLIDLLEVESFFDEWYANNIDEKSFIGREAYEDLKSLIRGTMNYVKLRFAESATASIHLHRLNSNVIENCFSSQRDACIGSSTNPSLLEYGKSINTIMLGQNLLSQNRNASSDIGLGGAMPMKLLTKEPFPRKAK